MNFSRKLVLIAVLAFSFLAGPMAQAEEGVHRHPAAEHGKKAKKKKPAKKSKATKSKTARSKNAGKRGSAKHAKKPAAPAGQAKHKSHMPTQPESKEAGPGEYQEISNEKKDELPPPANVEPKDE